LNLKISKSNLGYIAVIVFLALWFCEKLPFISTYILPGWDECVYLQCAHDIILGQPLLEPPRPPLISILIAGVWWYTGENYLLIRYLHPIFAVLSGFMFYLLVKKQKNEVFALVALGIFMTTTEVMFWSNFILPHAITLFFALFGAYLLGEKGSFKWFAGGIMLGLSIIARYPMVIIAGIIFFVFLIKNKQNIVSFIREVLIGILCVGIPIYLWSLTGLGISVEGLVISYSHQPAKATPLFYVENLFTLYNATVIVFFIGFILCTIYIKKQKLEDKLWFTWFVVSFLFWSITVHPELRFSFEWGPAVAFISTLSLEHIYKIRLPKIQVNSIFLGVLFLIIIIGSTNSVFLYSVRRENWAPDFYDADFIKMANSIKGRTNGSDIILVNDLYPELTYFSQRSIRYGEGYNFNNPAEIKDLTIDCKYVVYFSNGSGLNYSFLKLIEVYKLEVYPMAYCYEVVNK